jgi:hypothetical protein
MTTLLRPKAGKPFFFCANGAGKYEIRKFHVPKRSAGWLQGKFIYAGWVSVRL